jgi:hypothetical protein
VGRVNAVDDVLPFVPRAEAKIDDRCRALVGIVYVLGIENRYRVNGVLHTVTIHNECANPVRIPLDLARRLKTLAADHNRSLAGELRQAITVYLKHFDVQVKGSG